MPRGLCFHRDLSHRDSRRVQRPLAALRSALVSCKSIRGSITLTFSAMRLALGHFAFLSAIHLAISSSVCRVMLVPKTGGGGLGNQQDVKKQVSHH